MSTPPKRPFPLHDAPFHPWIDRGASGLVVALALVVLFFLWGAEPDGRGHGTHEQFGMQPCGWPVAYGIPCPTCGATTAATQLVQLHPIDALITQPFGVAVAIMGLWVAWLAVLSLATKQSFLWRVAFLPVPKYMLWGIVLLFASWGYKWLTWDDGPNPADVLPPWTPTDR